MEAGFLVYLMVLMATAITTVNPINPGSTGLIPFAVAVDPGHLRAHGDDGDDMPRLTPPPPARTMLACFMHKAGAGAALTAPTP